MTSDAEIIQDLFDTLGIHGARLCLPVNVEPLLAGAAGLRDLGRDRTTPPKQIMQCINQMYAGLGAVYFQMLFDTPADVDDFWVSYWCPQPPGVELHRADCPAETTPLWSNGNQTVFCRHSQDKHGNAELTFGVWRGAGNDRGDSSPQSAGN